MDSTMMDKLAESLGVELDLVEEQDDVEQTNAETFQERRKKPRPPKDRRRNDTAELLYFVTDKTS